MFRADLVPDSIGHYFAGFVDGEGSFHLSFRKRQDYKLPWKVSLCLNVSQKDEQILALLKRHLECGSIRFKGAGVWMYEVNNLNAIRENVIPFFRRFGFLSAKKKRDFAIFQQMAELMLEGAHLNEHGIRQLLKLRVNMNDGGKRKYAESEIVAAFRVPESSETICRTSAATSTIVVDSAAEDDIVRSVERSAEPGRNIPARDASEDQLSGQSE